MMQRRSPPKHRHDGTSPLPLGMDWSHPPRKWDGHNMVWPHDHRTGWSYCIIIPSWVVLPKSRDSDPVVFYRVQVGVQSPEGWTTTRGILRRFNDFMKLFTALKKEFPKKNLPPAPSKGLLRMKSRAMLEERRHSLEEWMTKLLSDIDISRSMSVASFLELEAAARTAFQGNPQSSEGSPSDNTNSSHQMHPSSSSIASDYGSDTVYETSEIGTPRTGQEEYFENGVEDLALDEDLTSPVEKLVKYGLSNIDEGLFMGQTILEQLENFPRHKPHGKGIGNGLEKDAYDQHTSEASLFDSNGGELDSEVEHRKVSVHARKLSDGSDGGDESSLRGTAVPDSDMPNSSPGGPLGIHGGAEIIVLPLDQRHKMYRVLSALQQRLVTTRTDMEDLLSRLNQEIAVKDYLTTKVTDLELELQSTKQKHKENLHQVIMIERERLTKMQWDMEEMKRKSLEMELKLKLKEETKLELGTESTDLDKDMALQQLDVARKQLENLSKQYEELELKSKADIKFLAKEFKSLKISQAELKQELNQSMKEKSEVEKCIQEEREMREQEKNERKRLLHDCRVLCDRLQECSVNFAFQDSELHLDSALTDTLDLLTTSDDQISVLLTQAQQLVKDDKTHSSVDDARMEDELRKMIATLISDNATLRKQVNSITLGMLKNGIISRNSTEVPKMKVNMQIDE